MRYCLNDDSYHSINEGQMSHSMFYLLLEQEARREGLASKISYVDAANSLKKTNERKLTPRRKIGRARTTHKSKNKPRRTY